MDSYIIDTPDFHLTQMEFLTRLLVACGIGLLIGLEREHDALTKNESIFAGIRTFVLLTMVGFIGAAMNFILSPLVFIIALSGAIILISLSYWITAHKGDVGGTSEITAIIAVLLGGMTFLGHIEISLMITVIIMVLLSSKLKFQTVIGKITNEELYSFIRFIVVALLIFPFLPDKTYGPYQVINPHEIGWVIILISGLGFVSYVLIRVFGSGKGILLTGILGGLLSSTMATYVFSKKSKEQPLLSAECATAIFAASSIMVIRVLILIFIFNKNLLPDLYLSFSIVFVAAAGITLYFYKKNRRQPDIEAAIPLGKPLNLSGALLFGVIFTAILFLVAFTNDYFGKQGIYFTSGVAGLTDVDAITISVSKLANDNITLFSAQNAILIATISNTLLKFGIALWTGSKEIRRYIYIGYGAIFLAAVLALVILNIL